MSEELIRCVLVRGKHSFTDSEGIRRTIRKGDVTELSAEHWLNFGDKFERLGGGDIPIIDPTPNPDPDFRENLESESDSEEDE